MNPFPQGTWGSPDASGTTGPGSGWPQPQQRGIPGLTTRGAPPAAHMGGLPALPPLPPLPALGSVPSLSSAAPYPSRPMPTGTGAGHGVGFGGAGAASSFSIIPSAPAPAPQQPPPMSGFGAQPPSMGSFGSPQAMSFAPVQPSLHMQPAPAPAPAPALAPQPVAPSPGLSASQAMSLLGAGMSLMSMGGGVGGAGAGAAAPGTGGLSFGGADSGAGSAVDAATAAFNNPMAQMALAGGSSFVKKNMSSWFSWLTLDRLRPYFHVDNSYVVRKIALVLFPFTHASWARKPRGSARAGAMPGGMLGSGTGESGITSLQQLQQQQLALQQQQPNLHNAGDFETPVSDLVAPDLYLPLMAFVTYILLRGYSSGLADSFHPEQLSGFASTALVAILFEVICLKSALYLAGTPGLSAGFLDIASYSAYKFVGFILAIFVGFLLGRSIFLLALFVVSVSNAFFLMKTYAGLLTVPSSAATLDGKPPQLTLGQVSRHKTFLLIVAGLQLFMAFALVRNAVTDQTALTTTFKSNTGRVLANAPPDAAPGFVPIPAEALIQQKAMQVDDVTLDDQEERVVVAKPPPRKVKAKGEPNPSGQWRARTVD